MKAKKEAVKQPEPHIPLTKPDNISFIPVRAATPTNMDLSKIGGQMPNRKLAEEILHNLKGSTLTNDGGSLGNRNGGLTFAPWMASQSFENISKTYEYSTQTNNFNNIKSTTQL